MTEWISTKAALEKYERTNGGRAALKASIAEHLRDGTVAARAVVLGPTEAVAHTIAWKRTRKATAEDVMQSAPPAIFRASKRWAADQSEWRWNAGNFSVSIASKPRARTMMRKVELAAADLKRVLNAPEAKSQGGRTPNVAAWQDFYFAVIKIAHDGKLNHKDNPDIAELWSNISKGMLPDGEFSTKIMKKAVGAVYKEFIEENRICDALNPRIGAPPN